MTKTFLKALLAAAALSAVAGAAQAQMVQPACTDNSRECIRKTTMLYLDGLSSHDATAIPFSPNVRCTEQGNVPVKDEKTFRSEINASKEILGMRSLRLLIDPETSSSAAFYMLDIAASGGKPAYTVLRGQRFKVVGGLVTEVEVYNYWDPVAGLTQPLWPD